MGTVEVIRGLNNAENNFLAELVAMFDKESERAVANLISAASTRDEKSLASYLHSFKGMSVNIGAEELAFLCKKMEDEFKTLSDDEIKASVEKIRECQLRTVAALKEQV